MSAPSQMGRQGPIHEDVPNEILLNIFEMATAVPDPLHRCHLDFHGNRRMERFARKRYDGSLATKRSLASVCRRWNALATPMLYTHIDVSGERKRSEDLMRTLSSPHLSETGCLQVELTTKERAIHLGKCVRRLDISIPLNCGRGPHQPLAKFRKSELALQERGFAEITNFLRDLTHLEVFVVTADVHPCAGVEMLQALSPTLQAIHWHVSAPFESDISLSSLVPRWVEFYNTHRNLVTVDIPCQLQLWAHLPTLENHLYGPPIRHLSLRNVVAISPATVEIPSSLRSISFLDPVLVNSAPTQFICQFIRAHGKQLTCVRLRLDPQHAFTEILGSLKVGCPHLQEIQLFLPYGADDLGLPRTATSVAVPTVTMLGLEFSRPRTGSTKGWKRAEHSVALAQSSWKMMFPNLQKMRLLLEADGDTFFKGGKTLAGRVLKLCRNRGIVVEDNFGNPLGEDSPVS